MTVTDARDAPDAPATDRRSADAPTRPRPAFVRWRAAAGASVLVAVLLLGYAGFLATYFSPAILHPDANGYWAQGTRLVNTGRTWFKPASDAQYVGMHWLLTPDGKYVSRYPPGLPVLVGVVYKAFGWEASVLVNPALATLTLLGVYLILAHVASPGWGLAGAILVAVNTAFTTHALTSISHPAVAFCLVWGVYLLLRWSEGGGVWWAFAAGAVFGCIPTIRYPDAVVALGVVAFGLLCWRRHPQIWKHYLAAAGGAAVPILPLLLRNQLVFGAFWRTGYALTNEQTGFSWKWFAQHAVGYLRLLQAAGLGAMFGIGLLGLIWMCCTKRRRPLGFLLLGSAGPLIVLYMAYYWAVGIQGGIGGPGGFMGFPGGGPAGAMRFYVPVVPPFVIAGTWAMAEALKSASKLAKIAVPAGLIALQATMYGPAMLDDLAKAQAEKVPMAMATRALAGVAGPDDVIVANPALLQQLDFVDAWKLADPSLVNGWGIRVGGGSRDPNDPSPNQAEKSAAEFRLYKGSMMDKQRRYRADLRAWAGKGQVYFVGTEYDLQKLVPGVRGRELTEVKRVKTPAPAADKASERGRAWRQFMAGGPFGYGVEPGQDLVIARWEKKG